MDEETNLSHHLGPWLVSEWTNEDISFTTGHQVLKTTYFCLPSLKVTPCSAVGLGHLVQFFFGQFHHPHLLGGVDPCTTTTSYLSSSFSAA